MMLSSCRNAQSVNSAPKLAAGRPGENRQRMDEILVENAEHDVDHEHGHDQQEEKALERRGERLGRADETVADRSAADPARERVDGGRSLR
jgi:hypothetical protein